LVRLFLPLAGIVAFFVLSLVTVRLVRPTQPRGFFLAYALSLLLIAVVIYVGLWPLDSLDDATGLVACLCAQALACLTMWNFFYSVLWGFSGGLMHDLYNEPDLRHVDRLVRSYDRDGGLDRILGRRLPNLAAGGFIVWNAFLLRLLLEVLAV